MIDAPLQVGERMICDCLKTLGIQNLKMTSHSCHREYCLTSLEVVIGLCFLDLVQ